MGMGMSKNTVDTISLSQSSAPIPTTTTTTITTTITTHALTRVPSSLDQYVANYALSVVLSGQSGIRAFVPVFVLSVVSYAQPGMTWDQLSGAS